MEFEETSHAAKELWNFKEEDEECNSKDQTTEIKRSCTFIVCCCLKSDWINDVFKLDFFWTIEQAPDNEPQFSG